ncbi:MAG: Bis(5'-nucleosyl)-tetraphosphatase, symmetrical [Legionellaceae bacterium]
MANYAIGDIQGCFNALEQLLKIIHFNPTHDQLWITGDLINRGPHSLKVLRFLKNLPIPPYIVLGNHDLHFLAVAYGVLPAHEKDTFDDVLMATDKEELCTWLRNQPLLWHDEKLNYAMTHAGIFPLWTLEEAKNYAHELAQLLQSPNYKDFLANQYGNTPIDWHQNLTGWERYRFIVNSFTRMRFCTLQGELELHTKTGIENTPPGLIPWFKFPHRKTQETNIIFGHWAALNRKVNEPQVFALDSGCVWGESLTAMRLEDKTYFHVSCCSK